MSVNGLDWHVANLVSIFIVSHCQGLCIIIN